MKSLPNSRPLLPALSLVLPVQAPWWVLADALLCTLSCALGAVSGWVIATLLEWSGVPTLLLCAAGMTFSCTVLTECPVMRRIAHILRRCG